MGPPYRSKQILYWVYQKGVRDFSEMMNCTFCLTGKMGFRRDLRVGEIVDQVLALQGQLKEKERITNLVLMGMGEPFLQEEQGTGDQGSMWTVRMGNIAFTFPSLPWGED